MSGRKRPRSRELAARYFGVVGSQYGYDAGGQWGRRHLDKYAGRRPMRCPRCGVVGVSAELAEHQKAAGHFGMPVAPGRAAV